MNIIHVGNSKTAIVAVHGFYPFYWVEIHHEWVQPFNYLVKKKIITFFTNTIGMNVQVQFLNTFQTNFRN